MQFSITNDIVVHYALAGVDSAPRLVFINSLGTDFRIWSDVVADLAHDYHCLCYDKRGHGLTDSGFKNDQKNDYSIDLLTDDLHALLQNLGWQKNITLIGVSIGGLIAQNYAYRFQEQVSRLVLMDTAAKIGDEHSWNERINTIKAHGISAISEQIMTRWFTDTYKDKYPANYQGYRTMLERTAPLAYCATCAALRDGDLRHQISSLTVPSLVVVGAQDGSTPPHLVEQTAQLIKNAHFELIDSCGHLPSIEQPKITINVLRHFIAGACYE